MPQSAWKSSLTNFCLNFSHPLAGEKEGDRRQQADCAAAMNYERFLLLEGSIERKNPYKEQIYQAALTLPIAEQEETFAVGKMQFEFVSSVEGLKKVITLILDKFVRGEEETAKKYPAIGLDVEHHHHLSYRGLTCLVQLSTPENNFLLDALNLLQQMHLLNEVTTNCEIVKVFHNAHVDVLWLQRDFGVYIVNAFDTGIAAKTLGKRSGETLWNWEKQEDFRSGLEAAVSAFEEPLPQDMIFYAIREEPSGVGG
ncbi:hypothetical protein Efla_002856 [Eimeria flavescens]